MAQYEYEVDDDQDRKELLRRIQNHERQGWDLVTITETIGPDWGDSAEADKPVHHYTAWLRRPAARTP